MTYTKQTWVNGDVITAEKLNNMESGISGASLPSITFDMTYAQGDDGSSYLDSIEITEYTMDNPNEYNGGVMITISVNSDWSITLYGVAYYENSQQYYTTERYAYNSNAGSGAVIKECFMIYNDYIKYLSTSPVTIS